jgi:hypothetical protein
MGRQFAYLSQTRPARELVLGPGVCSSNPTKNEKEAKPRLRFLDFGVKGLSPQQSAHTWSPVNDSRASSTEE